ncbi:MAG: CDP-alcohol phosphatidyltransferase family protein [Candidatus Marinimicrobia bacterium]|nr:CDP-alcohol phosphatidyltransferase family protein [Candidatus Neomarinimicrobiota bacterium]
MNNNKRKFKEYNKQMFKDYKKSIKHEFFDETLALYILRPIAFIFVRLLYPTSITPNQVSLMTAIAGIMSGYFFSRGDVVSFIIAGSLYFLSLVLDCVDGMIARLKNNGTAVGRIIDGLADYIVGISVYVGMGIGFGKGLVDIKYLPFNYWWFIVIAAISHIFHAIFVDYYRTEFMSHGLGKQISTLEEKNKFTAELDKIKNQKNKLFEKMLIVVYLRYLHLQLFKKNNNKVYDKETYYNSNKILIKLWFWIGPTASAFIIIISAFLFRPIIFFIFTIGFANIYMIILWIIQLRTNKKINSY